MKMPQQVGRYQPVRELGRGGMGVVYEATDPELGRAVAIKTILFPADTTESQRAELETRFRREARAAAGIRHPGVVEVHDIGRDGECLFLVMELIEGESLKAKMLRGDAPAGSEALELVARVADALAAAHALGVVHRDVKPPNILIDRGGRVVVTDFGVAHLLGDDSGLTRTNMVLGSPAYLAPEQARCQPFDHRADIFSLGIVLYELLLHRRPFPAEELATLAYQIVHQDPFADAEIAELLDPATLELLEECLAKSPEERLADMATFASRLRSLTVATEASGEDSSPGERPPRAAEPDRDEGAAKALEPTVPMSGHAKKRRARPAGSDVRRAARISTAGLMVLAAAVAVVVWMALLEKGIKETSQQLLTSVPGAGSVVPAPASGEEPAILAEPAPPPAADPDPPEETAPPPPPPAPGAGPPLRIVARVVDCRGGPLAGAAIGIFEPGRLPAAGKIRRQDLLILGTSDQRGLFDSGAARVPAGRYRIKVTLAGYRTFEDEVEIAAGSRPDTAVLAFRLEAE